METIEAIAFAGLGIIVLAPLLLLALRLHDRKWQAIRARRNAARGDSPPPPAPDERCGPSSSAD